MTIWLCNLFSVLQLFHYKFIIAFLFSEKWPKITHLIVWKIMAIVTTCTPSSAFLKDSPYSLHNTYIL